MIRRSGVMGGKTLRKRQARPHKGGVTRQAEPRDNGKLSKINMKESETTPVEDKQFVEEEKKKLEEEKKEFSSHAMEWTDIGKIENIEQLEVPEEPESPKVEEEEDELVRERDYFVVIDFEATCFKSRKVPREEMEVIEFAAALVDKETFEPVDEFDEFVRPVVHPTLDDFAVELTTITQDQVDSAFTFPTVLRQFTAWLEKYPGEKTFASWGGYDKDQLQQDCERHGVKYPFDTEHYNIKEVFRQKRGYKRQCGVKTALRRLRMDFEGVPHRGRDDVRNIIKIMRKAW